MSRHEAGGGALLAVGAVVALAVQPLVPAPSPVAEADAPAAARDVCAAAPDTTGVPLTAPPAFYAVDLVPTGRIVGTANFVGRAEVAFVDSPFDVAVSNEGTFHRRVRVDLRGLRPPPRGDYVVWATPPDLDPISRFGRIGDDMILTGEVAFPKFLLVVSLEDDPEAAAGRWSGPIVLRGMSRSGFMHTMAGHGPFQSEPCANYGFSAP